MTAISELSAEQIQQVNKQLAKEFIETRLDCPPIDKFVSRLANCITEIERAG